MLSNDNLEIPKLVDFKLFRQHLERPGAGLSLPEGHANHYNSSLTTVDVVTMPSLSSLSLTSPITKFVSTSSLAVARFHPEE